MRRTVYAPQGFRSHPAPGHRAAAAPLATRHRPVTTAPSEGAILEPVPAPESQRLSRSGGRVLFICGSLNQTTQMHQVARELAEHEHRFTPYYADGLLDLARRAGLLETTVLGEKLRARCLAYLAARGLPVDLHGRAGGYDLVVTCSDLVVPRNIRRSRVVLVQEGILDPLGRAFRLCRRLPFLPRWLAGTATTGLSGRYDRFCVASEGYRDLFVQNGAPADRVTATGIPNFDDCRRFRELPIPAGVELPEAGGFALACTSDARETWKRDDRRWFLRCAVDLAAGRPLVVKLHPNEDAARARREIARWAPGARVVASGSAEALIARCEVLITQYSSTAFVGLALGKEVHSYYSLDELRRLLPLQHGDAAARIAAVCREVLASQNAKAPEAAGVPALVSWEAGL